MATASQVAAAVAVDFPEHNFSYANIDAWRVSHVHVDLDVDLAARVLRGKTTLDVSRIDHTTQPLILDTESTIIARVEYRGADGELAEIRFDLADPIVGFESFGQALIIGDLPADVQQVRIHYMTTDKASGIQWIDDAGGAPMMFTQGEAVHARSYLGAIQDNPIARATYSGTLRVPFDSERPLTVLMSGANLRQPTVVDGWAEYRVDLPQTVPSYAVGLIAGRLAYASLGRNCGVFALPDMLPAAQEALRDTATLLAAGEKLFGPYRWETYDQVMMPWSFPLGGMENARLNFLSPTELRCPNPVSAHELGHSWAGNLVTAKSWREFWLNEGVNTYVETAILREVYGDDFATVLAASNTDALSAMVQGDLSQVIPLVFPEGAEKDPDEEITPQIYYRGWLMLERIAAVCGRDALHASLTSWFQDRAFQTVTTDDFVRHMRATLADRGIERVNFDAWLYGPGLPTDAPRFVSPQLEQARAWASRWQRLPDAAALQAASVAWTYLSWGAFLAALRDPTVEQLAALDALFDLTHSADADIALAWFKVAIVSGYYATPTVAAALRAYLLHTGRVRNIRPLYTHLVATPAGKRVAQEIYAEARAGYHPLARQEIEALLGGQPE